MYDHKGTVYGSSVVKVLFGVALIIIKTKVGLGLSLVERKGIKIHQSI